MKNRWIFIFLIFFLIVLSSCNTENLEPTEIFDSTESAESIEPTDSTETTESAETSEVTEPKEPAESGESIESTDTVEPTEATETSKEILKELEYEAEVIATGLKIPWEIVPMPDGRILITERGGSVLLLEKGEIYSIAEVKHEGEGGLLGMTLSPNFKEDNLIYLYYTYMEDKKTYNKVSQFIFKEDTIEDEKVILDKIPGSKFHNGGRIKFGPDDKLYITTGDAQEKSLSQDIESLAGKILRINPDGTIPSDNPFPSSPVFALGIRNSQGLAWHPATGDLFASDHGPSSRDEVNLIESGGNYGWPNITCDQVDPKYINPITCYTDFTLAPSGIDFYPKESQDGFSLYVAGLRGNRIMRVLLDKEGNFIKEESLFEDFGRVRTVVYYEDAIYIATNNTDGRGNPKKDDDKIIKISIKEK